MKFRLSDHRLLQLIVDTYKRYEDDSGGYLAAAITYYAFLSVYPLLLVHLFVLGWLFAGDTVSQAAWEARLFAFVPGIQALLAHNLKALIHARGTIGVIGFAGLIWTGLGMAHAASWSLARIFRVSARAGFFRRTATSFFSLAILSMLVLITIGLSGIIGGTTFLGMKGVVLRIIGIIVTLALDSLIFLMAYWNLAPTKELRLNHLWKGAILGGSGWTVLRIGSVWYFAIVVNRWSLVHGTFAAALAVLVVLYFGSCLFLYGAELNAVLQEEKST